MVSDLYVELDELVLLGVDLDDVDEAYEVASEAGLDLVATVISEYPAQYLSLVRQMWIEDLQTQGAFV